MNLKCCRSLWVFKKFIIFKRKYHVNGRLESGKPDYYSGNELVATVRTSHKRPRDERDVLTGPRGQPHY